MAASLYHRCTAHRYRLQAKSSGVRFHRRCHLRARQSRLFQLVVLLGNLQDLDRARSEILGLGKFSESLRLA